MKRHTPSITPAIVVARGVLIAAILTVVWLFVGCAEYQKTVAAREVSAGVSASGKGTINYRVEYHR